MDVFQPESYNATWGETGQPEVVVVSLSNLTAVDSGQELALLLMLTDEFVKKVDDALSQKEREITHV